MTALTQTTIPIDDIDHNVVPEPATQTVPAADLCRRHLNHRITYRPADGSTVTGHLVEVIHSNLPIAERHVTLTVDISRTDPTAALGWSGAGRIQVAPDVAVEVGA